MKVIHIATSDCGGAALGMISLHHALLEAGVESRILVAIKTSFEETIVQMQPNYDQFAFSKNIILRKFQKILRKRGYLLSEREKWDRKVSQVPVEKRSSCFTSPFSQYNILENSLVQESDIIHLHWVGDFIDYPSFFKNVNKPVVWTIRDENPGLGGFHYRKERELLYFAYKIVEDHYVSIKKDCLYQNKSLALINLSDYMMNFCQSVDYLSQKPSYKIYNVVDGKKFSIIDHHAARKALCVPEDAFVVSFVSVTLSDYRKNLDKVIDALKQLGNNWILLCVGQNGSFVCDDCRVCCYGPIADSRLMSIVYSASDVFVTPSLQESFGKTTIEALLCGTPVIASATGIAPEIINNANGIVLDEITDISILEALRFIQSNNYDRESIRDCVFDKFCPQRIAQEHIAVYNKVASACFEQK